MKDLLTQLVQKFNAKSKTDQKLISNLDGLEKSILIEFTDDGTYHFSLKNVQLSEVKEGSISSPDIVVKISTEVFNKILKKELDALSAYITRKLAVKASLADKLLLSELLK